MRRMGRGAAALSALAGLALADPAAARDAEIPCGGAPSEIVVADVLDARTVRLADGRLLRLAGLELGDHGEVTRPDVFGLVSGRTALAQALSDGSVRMAPAEPAVDRYGRLRGYLYVQSDGAPVRSVQEALLEAGVALHSGEGERSKSCTQHLRIAEAAARAAKRGVWTDGGDVVRPAADPRRISAHAGRFMLVEGKVQSVRESGGTIYVNFGRRWSEDFTVTIAKRGEAAFGVAGLNPKALQARTIRARGVVEERGGPWIEVTRPEQIEVLER